MKEIIYMPESMFKKIVVKRWQFDTKKRKYVRVDVYDELQKALKYWKREGKEMKRAAVFIHRQKGDPEMRLLAERKYWQGKDAWFEPFPTSDFDETTYMGKSLVGAEGHTDVLVFENVDRIYSTRNYWECLIDDGEGIQVPKGETKYAIVVIMGE